MEEKIFYRIIGEQLVHDDEERDYSEMSDSDTCFVKFKFCDYQPVHGSYHIINSDATKEEFK